MVWHGFCCCMLGLTKASVPKTLDSIPQETEMIDNNSTDSQTTSTAGYGYDTSSKTGNRRSSSAGNGSTAKANGSQKAMPEERKPARRGFAAMDPARQREIAAQGGRAAHESGNAHQFTVEEARAAGKKSHSTRQQRTALRAPL